MSGKAILILIFSFMLTTYVYQSQLGSTSVKVLDSFNQSYMELVVQQAAVSTMNMAINQVWDRTQEFSGIQMVADGCTAKAYIEFNGIDTVKIKSKAWAYLFDNNGAASSNNNVKLVDSLVAIFAYNIPISRYFWFTHNEAGVYWITGDSVWGPVHTNGVLKTSGSPVFFKKVTAGNGIYPSPWSWYSRAEFIGGWEIGIYADIPTDMSPLQQAANQGNGGAPINTKSVYNQPVAFNFLPSGEVIRQVGSNPPDTVLLSDIAPTGVIYCSEDIRIKGVLKGQLTLYSGDDIWIDDDIVYANDPNQDPNSDDLLGLVAEDKVIVTDNAPNNNNVNIQACIMAINGKFYAENYSTRPVAGTLKVTGSIVQRDRGPVGTFSSWTGQITHGFSKRYRYDPRLQSVSPPYYPYIRYLHLTGWWE
ncbi:MAG: hypothetical protein Kow0037_17160 [Calditrichia bacterium]